MISWTRRDALQLGAGALAGTTMLASGSLRAQIAVKDVAPPKFAIESGATLRVLRPSKFVQGDETLFLENSKKFTEQTGVQVTVTSESWEDLRPKTATAAAIGSGPDIVYAWSDDPHKFEAQCVDLTDLATYLGEKYGGWWPIVEKYGKSQATGKWIAMPVGGSGNRVVYRKSWVNEAGYETIPADLDGFLDMAKKLKAKGHPIGFALGNATGDANSWCHWLMWTFGGSLTDENDQVTINSKETIEALKYGKALAATFIPAPPPGSTRATTRRSSPARSPPPATASRSTMPPRTRRIAAMQGDGRGHLPRRGCRSARSAGRPSGR